MSTSLFHPVNIGGLQLDGNVFLAPMAGYTDKVFRGICLQNKAALAYTEMVSAEGLARNSEKTIRLMDRAEGEQNLAVQLFMPDASTAQRAIEKTLSVNPQLIDINMGCPVPKVTKTGAGSSLLKNPGEIRRIVETLVQGTSLPVTVKIRTGWDLEFINYLETAEAAFDGGASAVCMHARTRSQLYMPTANWFHLKNLKEHFPNSVIIGSGDVFSAEDVKKMLEETGVDAVAAARGAIGNPFLFAQAQALLTGAAVPVITLEEKTAAIRKHLYGLVQYLGEEVACREMRKHVCAYLKGIPNSSQVRNHITRSLTVKEYEEALSLLNTTPQIDQNAQLD